MTADVRGRVVARLSQMVEDETGQTTVETLMIVGLMAAVIVTVFTMMFWPAISSGVSTLVQKIMGAISGNGIG